MSGVTWIHLSDWHQGAPTSEGNYNRHVVLDKLLEDITHRAAINKDLAHIDFIVFSGDVAHAGAMDQYEAAKLFFDQLLTAAGLTGKRDRLFIVPGNHDLDDSVLETIEEADLRRPLDANNINKWIDAYLSASSDPTRHNLLMLPFNDYRRFIETYNQQDSPTYASLAALSLEGASAALVGLNSALMCRRKEEITLQEDFGKLIVGEPQVRKQLAALRGVDIKIAVMHHPLNWLCWPDQRRIRSVLTDNFDFLLYGHTHLYEAFDIVERWGKCFVVGAGCIYQSREYLNSYNYFHFDATTNKGTIWVRRWDDWVGEWIKGPFKTRGKIIYGGFYDFPQPEESPFPKGGDSTPPPEPPIRTHYSDIVDAILKGTVVPVLGADLNLCDHSDDNPWGWKLTSPHAPSNLEVTAFLEQELQGGMPVSIECPFCQGQADITPLACPLHAKRDVTWLDLPRISQDFWVREESLSARQTTILEAIRKINHTQFDSNAIYRFLTSKPLMQSYGSWQDDTEIVAGTRYPLIVTTCFDSTLEHAFLASRQPFKLVAFDAAWNRFLCRISVENTEGKLELSEPQTWDGTDLQLHKMPLVLRIFGPTGIEGSTDKAPFAITEDHFLDYLIKTSNFQMYPKPLAAKLRRSHLWFMGYNLSYWHLRMFIRQIQSDGASRQKWWAVQANFSRLARELWALDKKTDLFSHISFGDLETYISALRQRLEWQAKHK